MGSVAHTVTVDEDRALDGFDADGRLSLELYRGGVFSEPAFVLYGVLERLVIRKRLAFLGRTGDQKNAAYHYAFTDRGVVAEAGVAAAA